MSDRPDNNDVDVDTPSPEGLRVTTDLPYHILVVSDLAGSESGTISGPLNERILDISANSFDDVMKQASPKVSFTIADPVASGNVMVEVNHSFESVKDFHPDVVGPQLPAVRSLLGIRESLADRMRGKLSTEQLSSAVATAAANDPELAWLVDAIKWTPVAPVARPDVVDNLLGQIDLGDGADDGDDKPPAKSPIGSAVSAAAIGGNSIPPEEVSTVRRCLGEIDKRASAWLTAVLHSPQVQPLESAWRSLAFLVSKIEFRKGIRLSILHASRAELLDRVNSLLIDRVFDEGADAPDLIIVDHAFGISASDMEAIDELAQHGASLPAIVIAGISPAFFGVKHAWQMPTLPPIGNMFDQWQFAKWKAFREAPHARSLGVVFGRCLLRTPYGSDDAADLEFNYHEPRLAGKDFIWANGSIAAAVCIAKCVAERGWPTALSGMVHGRVDSLKTAMGGKKGDKKFGPTDTMIPQPKIEEMAIVGVNAAVGIKDHDDALMWNGLTAARPARMHPDAFLEVSLPYQLFAGRLGTLLFTLKPNLIGKSPEQVVSEVREHLCDWLNLGADAEEISVQTRPADDNPRAFDLAVTVTPPQQILTGGIPVVLGYRLT